MFDRVLIYRDRIIRVVLGTRPAILAKEADETALTRICASLVDIEDAKQLMCAQGHGLPSQSLTDMVRAMLMKEKAR